LTAFRTDPVATKKQRSAKRANQAKAFSLGLILPAAVLGLWYLVAAYGDFSATQLPSPDDVLTASATLISKGTLWGHLLISLQRVALGFLIGAILGIALGSLVGLNKLIAQLLLPTIGAVRAIPSLAWVPLLLIWMGIYEEPKVTLIALGAFFPVFTTVSAGLAAVDRNLIEVGRAYGLKGVKLVRKVLLPASAPTIFSGLRLGLAQAWLFLVAAELIASSKGLGFLLLDSQNTARTDVLFLTIIILALLGKASDALIAIIEKRVLHWV
jgi:sulfonate transport system permease protein